MIPGCNSAKLLQSRRTGVWGHILEDGTSCLGETPTTEPEQAVSGQQPAVSSDDDPPGARRIPDFGDTPLGNFQRELAKEGTEWGFFENAVLHMPWPEWVKLGGTVDSARTQWESFSQRKPTNR